MRIISTQTADGLLFSGALAEAAGKDVIIVHIHGMQGDFYENMEQYLIGYAEQGVSFLSGENRGSYVAKRFKTADGGGKVIGGAYEVFEECVHDIKAWIDCAESLGYGEIWLSSHSLAPAKVAYYMHQTNDPRVKGIIFLSPADNLGLVKDPIGAADHILCYPEATQLHEAGKGSQLLSHLLWGDKVLSADTYLNLFNDHSASNVFHYYDPSLDWGVIQSIKPPVIAFTGTKDDGIEPVMEPHAAMELLKKQLGNASHTKTLVLDGAEHSFEGFETQIIEQVVKFIMLASASQSASLVP